MKLRLKAALFVTVTLALTPIASAPAQATTCPSSNFCVYRDGYGDYYMWASSTNVSSYLGRTYPQDYSTPLNDSGSAFANRSGYGNRVSFYADESYGTFIVCVNPGSQGNAPIERNDQASSHWYQYGNLLGCK